ncbi:MAG: enoyl-CoA hydratase-related protein [Desulfomicrobium escambiense]|nr:enoyl-CoA hydratase-related protein [Desulfomicrobium escambiense]
MRTQHCQGGGRDDENGLQDGQGRGRGTVSRVFVMDNPPVNQLSEHFVRELADAFAEAFRDGAVKAVVLTGTGKNFIAGADITQIKDIRTRDRILAAAQGQQPLPQFHRNRPQTGGCRHQRQLPGRRAGARHGLPLPGGRPGWTSGRPRSRSGSSRAPAGPSGCRG